MILANDAEIIDPIHYKKVREKVVGIMFDFQEDVHTATESFIADITTDDARNFIEKNKDELLSIFSQSKTRNLRLLKQTLWTWERFYNVINEDMRAKSGGMLALFRLVVALCLEVRSGALTAIDLRNRVDSIVASSANRVGGLRSPEGAACGLILMAEHRADGTGGRQGWRFSAPPEGLVLDGRTTRRHTESQDQPSSPVPHARQ